MSGTLRVRSLITVLQGEEVPAYLGKRPIWFATFD